MTPPGGDEGDEGDELEALEPREPVRALARLVSPAVRVEPDRVRAVRLAFLPRSAASLEADLWSSPLVQARNAGGLVLRPDVIVALREELVGRALVPELRAVHETFQRALPPLLAIEEEIVWLALTGADDGVAGHLLSVLKTMTSQPDRAQGLASWAARALGELPAAVRNTPAAIHLEIATSARLRRPIRVAALHAGPGLLALPDLLPPDLPDVQVAVERRGDRLVFEIPAEPREGAGLLDAPATDPVILAMTSGGATAVVTVQPGMQSLARVRGDTVTLRTLRGDEWELARRPAVRAAAPRRAFAWIHLSNLLLSSARSDEREPMTALGRDLEHMTAEVGHIGALFVTGDLTSRGSRDELLWADRFLNQLVGKRHIPVFAVPGNHDYDRSRKGHRPYEQWWQHRDLGNQVELHHGRVPGDFVATLHTDEARVGIVGLNTARSGSGTPYGIGPYGAGPYGGVGGATLDAGQIGELVPDLDAWSAAHDITVLLTHHPRDVILEDTRLDFDRLVAPPGVFDVHLSADSGESSAGWTLGTTLQVRGRSLQAVPARRLPPPPGYWLGRVEQGDARQATLWSRTWNEKTATFQPDRWARGLGTSAQLDTARVALKAFPPSVTIALMPRPLSRIPRFVAGEILARLGRGSSLLLYGPPGAGKTTLLDDLAQRLPATRRVSADDADTLARLRREHDAGTAVIWLVDDIDRVPEAQRLALFERFSPRPGSRAASTICFTARSFESHGGAPGIEPVAVPDVDEAELTVLFARRLAAFGAPPETAQEIFAWTGGHIALAARIIDGLERDPHPSVAHVVELARMSPVLAPPSVAHVVERAILSPDAAPPLPAPQVSEAALDLYQALLRSEHVPSVGTYFGDINAKYHARLRGERVPRALARATAELLASGLAIEAIGETGSNELHVRNRIIHQVYDQRWVDRALPAPPARWVLVAGNSDADVSPALRDVATRLGEALARRRMGLVTREYAGVYQTCGTRYAETCDELGLSPRRRIRCVSSRTGSVNLAFPAEIRPARSPLTEAVDTADAVVVLSDGNRTSKMFEHAYHTRKPILAVGALGGSAINHFHRVIHTFQRGDVLAFNDAVAAIPLGDYERLNDPGEDAVVATLLHLLDLLFARA